MNFKLINLEDTLTSGGLFHIDIEEWKCALGFCLNKEKEDKIVYVIINRVVPEELINMVFSTAVDLIKYSENFSDYKIKFYYDEDFKITKLYEQDSSCS